MENSSVIRRPDHEISRGHFNTRTSDGSLIQQQWNRNWTPPCHIIFKYLTPSSLVVVGIKYQAISEDPSTTRPLQTWSMLISIFIYSLIPFAANQSRKLYDNYLKSLGRIALASGAVSSLSLISLLLPHFPGLPLLYTSWALSVLISAFPIVYCTYNWLFTGIKTTLDVAISSARNLFTRWTSGEQQPPPQGTRPPV